MVLRGNSGSWWLFEVLCSSSRFSVVLRDSLWFFEVLCGSSRFSAVLRHLTGIFRGSRHYLWFFDDF